jgi:hypothetical protein
MDGCPTAYFGDCQCSNAGVVMAHFGDASHYPRSGFFRKGRRLFCVQKTPALVGRHFWATLLRSDVDNFGTVSNMYLLFMRYRPPAPEPSHGWAFPITAFLNGATPIVHVWRIQRAVRQWLRRKWEERALAVMMMSHVRLGALSGLALVPSDVIRLNVIWFSATT